MEFVIVVKINQTRTNDLLIRAFFLVVVELDSENLKQDIRFNKLGGSSVRMYLIPQMGKLHKKALTLIQLGFFYFTYLEKNVCFDKKVVSKWVVPFHEKNYHEHIRT